MAGGCLSSEDRNLRALDGVGEAIAERASGDSCAPPLVRPDRVVPSLAESVIRLVWLCGDDDSGPERDPEAEGAD
jgi:hypothetical protein